jgi:hypothetical protein
VSRRQGTLKRICGAGALVAVPTLGLILRFAPNVPAVVGFCGLIAGFGVLQAAIDRNDPHLDRAARRADDGTVGFD